MIVHFQIHFYRVDKSSYFLPVAHTYQFLFLKAMYQIVTDYNVIRAEILPIRTTYINFNFVGLILFSVEHLK